MFDEYDDYDDMDDIYDRPLNTAKGDKPLFTIPEIAENQVWNAVRVAQLNRESEKGKRPKASDLKESGQIEQDADQIILAHPILNSEDELPSGITEIIVAKNRHGKRGVVRVMDRLDICRFVGISEEAGGAA